MAFQGDSIYWVEVEKIVPNPYQPRREFDEGKLQELADSVRMYGVLQPLTVTRKEVSREDGTFFTEYELIAGERRLRASRLAKLAQVPVIIRTGEQSDQEKLELAIIENLQREDLNAVDRAIAFRQLADQFSLSHSQVAKKVGRSREYVSNSLRLLQLPEYMLTSLKAGDISEGHGRTLLMLNDRPEEQDTVFRETMLKKLSVREVERIARKIATDKVRKKDWGIDPVLIEIEKKFTDTLGTRVQIQKTDFGGKLMIDYFTDEDLTKILDMINVEVAENPEVRAIAAATSLEAATPLEMVEDTTPAHAAQTHEAAPEPAPETPSEPVVRLASEGPAHQQAEPEVVPAPQVAEPPQVQDSTLAPEPATAWPTAQWGAAVAKAPVATPEPAVAAPAEMVTTLKENREEESVSVHTERQSLIPNATAQQAVPKQPPETPAAANPGRIASAVSMMSQFASKAPESDIQETPERAAIPTVESAVPAAESVAAPIPQAAPQPTEKPAPEDDADLYNMRNFGI